jgi:predicted nucleotide-binding protein (sugar kinase/HSP70/actin superfamily)
MALDGLGLRDFRMFLLAQNELDQGSGNGGGLEINMKLSMGLVWAILCADVLCDLEYMTRPYELNAGQTDKVLKESIEYMYDVFRRRPLRGKKWGVLAWHLLTAYFTGALRDVRKKWDAIPVNRLQAKPKIKITGEFWLQTHEGDGNYNIKHWLEQESAEVVPPPVAVWLDYLLQQPIYRLERHDHIDKRARLKILLLKGLEKIYLGTYNRFRKALGGLPNELPDQEELRRLAKPFFNHQLRGGEGHMLIGKALYAYQHRKAHMICELSPYACMPNTMSIGSMANVLGKYPGMLYAPIEIKGDAEIHALSRCQMILTEAKKRAQRELEDVLDRERISIDAVRSYESRHPDVTPVQHTRFRITATPERPPIT